MLLGTLKGRSRSILTGFASDIPELCPFIKSETVKFQVSVPLLDFDSDTAYFNLWDMEYFEFF